MERELFVSGEPKLFRAYSTISSVIITDHGVISYAANTQFLCLNGGKCLNILIYLFRVAYLHGANGPY